MIVTTRVGVEEAVTQSSSLAQEKRDYHVWACTGRVLKPAETAQPTTNSSGTYL